MRWAPALLLLLPMMAGCLLSPGGGSDDDSSGNPSQQGSNSTKTKGPLVKAPNGTATAPNGTTNSSASGAGPSPPRIWAEPSLATIRPGASLDAGSCTANFVFTSLDNSTTYLGTAAHCFSNDINTQTNGCLADVQPLGSKRDVSGANGPGTLVYSSWVAMQANNETSTLCNNNDFALLQLGDIDATKVSPALWKFGGPTGLAATRDVNTFDRVLSYGNSGSRPEDSALSPREGYVTLPSGGCDTRVVFPNAAIPGDSGSPVILSDGLALGVFVSIELAPLPGQGHVCHLSSLLAYASSVGFDVQLATWELLDDGTLPP